VYSSAVFIVGGGRPLHSNFTRTGRPPSTILGVRKLDTGLPDGEDCVPLCSLVLTTLECDAQTDGRTDLPLHIQR